MRYLATAVGSAAVGLAVVLAVHSTSSRSPVVVQPAATPSASARPGGPTTSTAPPPPGTRVLVGTAENYGYGVLSVQVTLRGNEITDVTVTSLQASAPYSQALAAQAIPTLRNEVLSAQSANVDTISGATYTSEAYLDSVQSALDQAHA